MNILKEYKKSIARAVSVDPAKALKKPNIPPLLFDLIDLVSNPIYINIVYYKIVNT